MTPAAGHGRDAERVPAPTHPADDRDLVVLRVPADPGYARVARVAVSAYAVRLGLRPADVEDLRLAVDEALILLMGAAGPMRVEGDGEGSARQDVVLTLDAADDRPPVSVELRLEPPLPAGEPDLAALSRFEEIIPPGVTVEAVDQDLGRVALRHPG